MSSNPLPNVPSRPSRKNIAVNIPSAPVPATPTVPAAPVPAAPTPPLDSITSHRPSPPNPTQVASTSTPPSSNLSLNKLYESCDPAALSLSNDDLDSHTSSITTTSPQPAPGALGITPHISLPANRSTESTAVAGVTPPTPLDSPRNSPSKPTDGHTSLESHTSFVNDFAINQDTARQSRNSISRHKRLFLDPDIDAGDNSLRLSPSSNNRVSSSANDGAEFHPMTAAAIAQASSSATSSFNASSSRPSTQQALAPAAAAAVAANQTKEFQRRSHECASCGCALLYHGQVPKSPHYFVKYAMKCIDCGYFHPDRTGLSTMPHLQDNQHIIPPVVESACSVTQSLPDFGATHFFCPNCLNHLHNPKSLTSTHAGHLLVNYPLVPPPTVLYTPSQLVLRDFRALTTQKHILFHIAQACRPIYTDNLLTTSFAPSHNTVPNSSNRLPPRVTSVNVSSLLAQLRVALLSSGPHLPLLGRLMAPQGTDALSCLHNASCPRMLATQGGGQRPTGPGAASRAGTAQSPGVTFNESNMHVSSSFSGSVSSSNLLAPTQAAAARSPALGGSRQSSSSSHLCACMLYTGSYALQFHANSPVHPSGISTDDRLRWLSYRDSLYIIKSMFLALFSLPGANGSGIASSRSHQVKANTVQLQQAPSYSHSVSERVSLRLESPDDEHTIDVDHDLEIADAAAAAAATAAAATLSHDDSPAVHSETFFAQCHSISTSFTHTFTSPPSLGLNDAAVVTLFAPNSIHSTLIELLCASTGLISAHLHFTYQTSQLCGLLHHPNPAQKDPLQSIKPLRATHGWEDVIDNTVSFTAPRNATPSAEPPQQFYLPALPHVHKSLSLPKKQYFSLPVSMLSLLASLRSIQTNIVATTPTVAAVLLVMLQSQFAHYNNLYQEQVRAAASDATNGTPSVLISPPTDTPFPPEAFTSPQAAKFTYDIELLNGVELPHLRCIVILHDVPLYFFIAGVHVISMASLIQAGFTHTNKLCIDEEEHKRGFSLPLARHVQQLISFAQTTNRLHKSTSLDLMQSHSSAHDASPIHASAANQLDSVSPTGGRDSPAEIPLELNSRVLSQIALPKFNTQQQRFFFPRLESWPFGSVEQPAPSQLSDKFGPNSSRTLPKNDGANAARPDLQRSVSSSIAAKSAMFSQSAQTFTSPVHSSSVTVAQITNDAPQQSSTLVDVPRAVIDAPVTLPHLRTYDLVLSYAITGSSHQHHDEGANAPAPVFAPLSSQDKQAAAELHSAAESSPPTHLTHPVAQTPSPARFAVLGHQFFAHSLAASSSNKAILGSSTATSPSQDPLPVEILHEPLSHLNGKRALYNVVFGHGHCCVFSHAQDRESKTTIDQYLRNIGGSASLVQSDSDTVASWAATLSLLDQQRVAFFWLVSHLHPTSLSAVPSVWSTLFALYQKIYEGLFRKIFVMLTVNLSDIPNKIDTILSTNAPTPSSGSGNAVVPFPSPNPSSPMLLFGNSAVSSPLNAVSNSAAFAANALQTPPPLPLVIRLTTTKVIAYLRFRLGLRLRALFVGSANVDPSLFLFLRTIAGGLGNGVDDAIRTHAYIMGRNALLTQPIAYTHLCNPLLGGPGGAAASAAAHSFHNENSTSSSLSSLGFLAGAVNKPAADATNAAVVPIVQQQVPDVLEFTSEVAEMQHNRFIPFVLKGNVPILLQDAATVEWFGLQDGWRLFKFLPLSEAVEVAHNLNTTLFYPPLLVCDELNKKPLVTPRIASFLSNTTVSQFSGVDTDLNSPVNLASLDEFPASGRSSPVFAPALSTGSFPHLSTENVVVPAAVPSALVLAPSPAHGSLTDRPMNGYLKQSQLSGSLIGAPVSDDAYQFVPTVITLDCIDLPVVSTLPPIPCFELYGNTEIGLISMDQSLLPANAAAAKLVNNTQSQMTFSSSKLLEDTAEASTSTLTPFNFLANQPHSSAALLDSPRHMDYSSDALRISQTLTTTPRGLSGGLFKQPTDVVRLRSVYLHEASGLYFYHNIDADGNMVGSYQSVAALSRHGIFPIHSATAPQVVLPKSNIAESPTQGQDDIAPPITSHPFTTAPSSTSSTGSVSSPEILSAPPTHVMLRGELIVFNVGKSLEYYGAQLADPAALRKQHVQLLQRLRLPLDILDVCSPHASFLPNGWFCTQDLVQQRVFVDPLPHTDFSQFALHMNYNILHFNGFNTLGRIQRLSKTAQSGGRYVDWSLLESLLNQKLVFADASLLPRITYHDNPQYHTTVRRRFDHILADDDGDDDEPDSSNPLLNLKVATKEQRVADVPASNAQDFLPRHSKHYYDFIASNADVSNADVNSPTLLNTLHMRNLCIPISRDSAVSPDLKVGLVKGPRMVNQATILLPGIDFVLPANLVAQYNVTKMPSAVCVVLVDDAALALLDCLRDPAEPSDAAATAQLKTLPGFRGIVPSQHIVEFYRQHVQCVVCNALHLPLHYVPEVIVVTTQPFTMDNYCISTTGKLVRPAAALRILQPIAYAIGKWVESAAAAAAAKPVEPLLSPTQRTSRGRDPSLTRTSAAESMIMSPPLLAAPSQPTPIDELALLLSLVTSVVNLMGVDVSTLVPHIDFYLQIITAALATQRQEQYRTEKALVSSRRKRFASTMPGESDNLIVWDTPIDQVNRVLIHLVSSNNSLQQPLSTLGADAFTLQRFISYLHQRYDYLGGHLLMSMSLLDLYDTINKLIVQRHHTRWRKAVQMHQNTIRMIANAAAGDSSHISPAAAAASTTDSVTSLTQTGTMTLAQLDQLSILPRRLSRYVPPSLLQQQQEIMTKQQAATPTPTPPPTAVPPSAESFPSLPPTSPSSPVPAVPTRGITIHRSGDGPGGMRSMSRPARLRQSVSPTPPSQRGGGPQILTQVSESSSIPQDTSPPRRRLRERSVSRAPSVTPPVSRRPMLSSLQELPSVPLPPPPNEEEEDENSGVVSASGVIPVAADVAALTAPGPALSDMAAPNDPAANAPVSSRFRGNHRSPSAARSAAPLPVTPSRPPRRAASRSTSRAPPNLPLPSLPNLPLPATPPPSDDEGDDKPTLSQSVSGVTSSFNATPSATGLPAFPALPGRPGALLAGRKAAPVPQSKKVQPMGLAALITPPSDSTLLDVFSMEMSSFLLQQPEDTQLIVQSMVVLTNTDTSPSGAPLPVATDAASKNTVPPASNPDASSSSFGRKLFSLRSRGKSVAPPVRDTADNSLSVSSSVTSTASTSVQSPSNLPASTSTSMTPHAVNLHQLSLPSGKDLRLRYVSLVTGASELLGMHLLKQLLFDAFQYIPPNRAQSLHLHPTEYPRTVIAAVSVTPEDAEAYHNHRRIVQQARGQLKYVPVCSSFHNLNEEHNCFFFKAAVAAFKLQQRMIDAKMLLPCDCGALEGPGSPCLRQHRDKFLFPSADLAAFAMSPNGDSIADTLLSNDQQQQQYHQHGGKWRTFPYICACMFNSLLILPIDDSAEFWGMPLGNNTRLVSDATAAARQRSTNASQGDSTSDLASSRSTGDNLNSNQLGDQQQSVLLTKYSKQLSLGLAGEINFLFSLRPNLFHMNYAVAHPKHASPSVLALSLVLSRIYTAATDNNRTQSFTQLYDHNVQSLITAATLAKVGSQFRKLLHSKMTNRIPNPALDMTFASGSQSFFNPNSTGLAANSSWFDIRMYHLGSAETIAPNSVTGAPFSLDQIFSMKSSLIPDHIDSTVVPTRDLGVVIADDPHKKRKQVVLCRICPATGVVSTVDDDGTEPTNPDLVQNDASLLSSRPSSAPAAIVDKPTAAPRRTAPSKLPVVDAALFVYSGYRQTTLVGERLLVGCCRSWGIPLLVFNCGNVTTPWGSNNDAFYNVNPLQTTGFEQPLETIPSEYEFCPPTGRNAPIVMHAPDYHFENSLTSVSPSSSVFNPQLAPAHATLLVGDGPTASLASATEQELFAHQRRRVAAESAPKSRSSIFSFRSSKSIFSSSSSSSQQTGTVTTTQETFTIDETSASASFNAPQYSPHARNSMRTTAGFAKLHLNPLIGVLSPAQLPMEALAAPGTALVTAPSESGSLVGDMYPPKDLAAISSGTVLWKTPNPPLPPSFDNLPDIHLPTQEIQPVAYYNPNQLIAAEGLIVPQSSAQFPNDFVHSLLATIGLQHTTPPLTDTRGTPHSNAAAAAAAAASRCLPGAEQLDRDDMRVARSRDVSIHIYPVDWLVLAVVQISAHHDFLPVFYSFYQGDTMTAQHVHDASEQVASNASSAADLPTSYSIDNLAVMTLQNHPIPLASAPQLSSSRLSAALTKPHVPRSSTFGYIAAPQPPSADRFYDVVLTSVSLSEQLLLSRVRQFDYSLVAANADEHTCTEALWFDYHTELNPGVLKHIRGMYFRGSTPGGATNAAAAASSATATTTAQKQQLNNGIDVDGQLNPNYIASSLSLLTQNAINALQNNSNLTSNAAIADYLNQLQTNSNLATWSHNGMRIVLTHFQPTSLDAIVKKCLRVSYDATKTALPHNLSLGASAAALLAKTSAARSPEGGKVPLDRLINHLILPSHIVNVNRQLPTNPIFPTAASTRAARNQQNAARAALAGHFNNGNTSNSLLQLMHTLKRGKGDAATPHINTIFDGQFGNSSTVTVGNNYPGYDADGNVSGPAGAATAALSTTSGFDSTEDSGSLYHYSGAPSTPVVATPAAAVAVAPSNISIAEDEYSSEGPMPGLSAELVEMAQRGKRRGRGNLPTNALPTKTTRRSLFAGAEMNDPSIAAAAAAAVAANGGAVPSGDLSPRANTHGVTSPADTDLAMRLETMNTVDTPVQLFNNRGVFCLPNPRRIVVSSTYANWLLTLASPIYLYFYDRNLVRQQFKIASPLFTQYLSFLSSSTEIRNDTMWCSLSSHLLLYHLGVTPVNGNNQAILQHYLTSLTQRFLQHVFLTQLRREIRYNRRTAARSRRPVPIPQNTPSH